MAETLLSPGVLTRENDQSQVTQGPITAGAAVVGPTVKGPVNIPTLVTSYSDYISKFGGSFVSGGTTQEYLTSISAYNYFQQGGTSLLVTRVVNGNFSSATTTPILNRSLVEKSNGESGILNTTVDSLKNSFNSVKAAPGSYTGLAATGSISGSGATLNVILDATASIESVTVTNGGIGFVPGEILRVPSASLTGTTARGILTADSGALNNAFTSVKAAPGVYAGLTATGNLSGSGAILDVTLNATGSISSVTVVNGGTKFVSGETLTISSSLLTATSASGVLLTTPNALSSSFVSVKALPKTYTGLAATGSASGRGVILDVIVDATGSISYVSASNGGYGFVQNENLTVPSSLLTGSVASGILSTVANALLNASASVTASAGTYTNLGATGSISGVGAILNVTLDTTGSLSAVTVTNGGSKFVPGEILTISSSLLSGSISRGILSTVVDALSGSFTSVSASVGTNTGVGATGSISGVGVVLDVTLDTTSSISTVTVTNGGTGFVPGELLRVPSASLTGGEADLVFTLIADDFTSEKSDLTFTIAEQDLLAEKQDLVFTVVADDFATEKSNLTFTLTSADLVSEKTDLLFTITAEDIDDTMVLDNKPFELETISEGEIMNSGIASGSNNSLISGSAENLRFEIVNANTGSGVFSLLIRRGNDTDNSKVVLESWANLSLDPNSPNYIESVIGNQVVDVSEGYTNVSGDFTNKSRYVRVKSVNTTTPNYLDNDGIAKSAYTASIPFNQTGSFVGAVGTLSGVYGLTGANYTSSLALLANKDEFRYNVITIPGLTQADNSDAVAVLLTNTTERGDAIAVIDLTNESANLTTAINEASSLDNSYTATYWPWVQVNAPNTGKLTWVPASTIIPSVYAYNDRVAAPWFAPAGFSRGGLSVIQAKRKLSPADRDTLYASNINSIATFPGQGVVAYGQKTLQKKASALDRVNVRRLLIELKSYIGQVANTLVFEQNSNATRNRFLAQTNPYLASIQQRQGLYSYKVVMDDTNNTADVIDRNQLVGQIYIQPTKTAEFIILDFNVTPTGATF